MLLYDMPLDAGSKLTYRRDIDGLRAVAVLLVVLFHIRTRITGGYIGVDVFFVISGYLISSTILSEMSTGKFSILNFYERRIRRIFPALLAMLFVTTALAYRYFAPSDMEAYARSLLAALFSVSNFLFAHQAGYFDGASGQQPLLHTWSLAVEEQFYIFFPLMLVVVQRWAPSRQKGVIWTVTGVTFLLACIWVRRDATFGFFFAPLRAWELLIGTIVSQHYLPAIHSRIARNGASLAGILLILIPAFAYNSGVVFPGLSALPPCIGAALIIAAGENGPSVVGSMLSWRPVVFIGLISYSLYLWHWPVLVLQETNFLFMDRPGDSKIPRAVVFIVSVILGALSWRFVETPFRKGFFRPGRRSLFQLAGTCTALLTVIGLILIATHGVPSRFPAKAVLVGSYINSQPSNEWREKSCFLLPENPFSGFAHSDCLQDDPTRKHYLLLGDSLAAALYPGLSEVFPQINISQATVAACPPFLPSGGPRSNGKVNCTKMGQYIFGDYLLHNPVDTVLLGGDWRDGDLPKLAQTVNWIHLHGMKVVVFGATNMYDQSLPRLLFVALREQNLKYLTNHFLLMERQIDRSRAETVRIQWKVPYISIYEDLCNTLAMDAEHTSTEMIDGCPIYAEGGIPLLFDKHHLTVSGSLSFAKAVKAQHQFPGV